MNTRDKLAAGKYRNKIPYSVEKIPVNDDMTIKQARDHEAAEIERKRTHRTLYRNEESRLASVVRADLEGDHGVSGHPRADKLWSLAWEHGHSGGWSEIINYYEEFVELIR